MNAGLAHCGQVVGLIHSIPTVKEVIDAIIAGAEEIIKKGFTPSWRVGEIVKKDGVKYNINRKRLWRDRIVA